MDGQFHEGVLEPPRNPRLYAYTHTREAEQTMLRVMLSRLHSLGIEGSVGREVVEYQGSKVEMAYVEYKPPEDWTFCDVELLATQINKKLGDILCSTNPSTNESSETN